MPVLRVHLFGQPAGGFDDMTALPNLGAKALTLLVYLLLKPRQSHRRETLCTLLWGERPDHKARACLNTTVWRLRRGLHTAADGGDRYVIASASGDLGFNWERDHWVDLHAFERGAVRFLAVDIERLSAADIDEMKSRMDLVGGELLEGFYDDWALRERERLRLLYLDSAAHLMRYFRLHETLDEGLTFANLILHRDPLRESVHRELMWIHWRLGHRGRALQQYHRCCVMLDEELGVGPMPETRALYEQIVSGTEVNSTPMTFELTTQAPASASAATLEDISDQLRNTMQSIDQAQSTLAHVLHQLKQWQADNSSEEPGLQ